MERVVSMKMDRLYIHSGHNPGPGPTYQHRSLLHCNLLKWVVYYSLVYCTFLSDPKGAGLLEAFKTCPFLSVRTSVNLQSIEFCPT